MPLFEMTIEAEAGAHPVSAGDTLVSYTVRDFNEHGDYFSLVDTERVDGEEADVPPVMAIHHDLIHNWTAEKVEER